MAACPHLLTLCVWAGGIVSTRIFSSGTRRQVFTMFTIKIVHTLAIVLWTGDFVANPSVQTNRELWIVTWVLRFTVRPKKVGGTLTKVRFLRNWQVPPFREIVACSRVFAPCLILCCFPDLGVCWIWARRCWRDGCCLTIKINQRYDDRAWPPRCTTAAVGPKSAPRWSVFRGVRWVCGGIYMIVIHRGRCNFRKKWARGGYLKQNWVNLCEFRLNWKRFFMLARVHRKA